MANELGRVGGRALAAQDEVAANRALLEFQSPTIALVSKPVPRLAFYSTYVLATMLAVFLTIAGTVPIDRVVSATGRVVSESSNMLVQPLETSIVRSIDVKVGQQVHKGDLLARLDPTFAGADLEGLKTQTASLQAEVDRLTAEGKGTIYVGDATAAGQLQAAIFKQRQAEYGFKMETYRQKISSLASTMAKAQGEIANYTEQLRIAQDMLAARQRLEREGVGSKFNTQQALSQATEERRALNGAIQTAASSRQDMDALIAERDGYTQQWHAESSQQLNDAARKLADASDQLAKAQRRHDLVEMRAEQDGVVLAIASVSPGSVLSVAEPFITLVPDDATMEVDAAIPASDVGFVRVGDEVTIKFDAYRFFEHGYAEGHVRVVAPDSQTTPTEGPDKPRIDAVPLGSALYRVKISIDTMKMTNLPADFRLQPGLGIDADIKVGQRTMLSYLLSRFIPSFTEGMREP
jgi:HlyD family secretion protein